MTLEQYKQYMMSKLHVYNLTDSELKSLYRSFIKNHYKRKPKFITYPQLNGDIAQMSLDMSLDMCMDDFYSPLHRDEFYQDT